MSSKIIDDIDVKILRDLLQDGRKEFSTIAEEAQVSKGVICQHYKKMEKTGIIVGATATIDCNALGYNTNAFISLRVPIQEQQHAIEKLSMIPGLYGVYRWGSSQNLWAVLHLTEAQKSDDVKQFIKKIPSVLRLEFEIWLGTRFLLTNLSILSNEDSPSDLRTRTPEENAIQRDLIDIDKLNRQIIEELVFNGRVTFSNIAKKTGTSISTVMRRYQELTRKHVLKTSIQINPSKLGYPSNAGFKLIANGQNDLCKIADTISKIPDVYAIFKTLGTHDFTVFACVKDLEHLLSLEDQMGNVTGVQEERATVLSLELERLPYPGIPIANF